MKTITLKCPGACIIFSPFGGQLLSYTRNGVERLFMSKFAIIDGSKPIRGGIPICWPWFGRSRLPAHGVARTSVFDVLEQHEGESIYVKMKLVYDDLELIVEISVQSELEVTLTTTNRRIQSVPIQQALHSYFAVSEPLVTEAFRSCHALDKITNKSLVLDVVDTSAETDLVIDYSGPVSVGGSLVTTNGEKTVVWNPGKSAAAMSDLVSPDGFVCVEALGEAEVGAGQSLVTGMVVK